MEEEWGVLQEQAEIATATDPPTEVAMHSWRKASIGPLHQYDEAAQNGFRTMFDALGRFGGDSARVVKAGPTPSKRLSL